MTAESLTTMASGDDGGGGDGGGGDGGGGEGGGAEGGGDEGDGEEDGGGESGGRDGAPGTPLWPSLSSPQHSMRRVSSMMPQA